MLGDDKASVLQIMLAGGPRVRARGARLDPAALGGRRAEVAFARLALDAGHPVSRDELADAIWGEPLPSSWRAALRNVIAAIRRAVAAAGLERVTVVESSGDGYMLELPTGSTIDLPRRRGSSSRARARLIAHPPIGAGAGATAALIDVRARMYGTSRT